MNQVSTLIKYKKYQVMYHFNPFDFAGYWGHVCQFEMNVERGLTHVGPM